MKIFLSYRRADAGDLADQIYQSSLSNSNDIFRDVNSIQAGDVWSKTIENNISICDILIVILTPGALESSEVEKEVLMAKKNNKKIMPCFYTYVDKDQIKWELGTFEGIEFANKYELVRNLQIKLGMSKKRREKVSNTSITDESNIGTPFKIDTNREISADSLRKANADQSRLKIEPTKRSKQENIKRPKIKTKRLGTQHVPLSKQRPQVRKTPTQTKQSHKVISNAIHEVITKGFGPVLIDKEDSRYLRLSSLSPLKKNDNSRWYQKLVTLNRDEKKPITTFKYCPECKKLRNIYTNKAMKDAAWPDVVGVCSVCGALLKIGSSYFNR